MVCDLTIAADNAIFGQTGPKVISCLLCIMLSRMQIIPYPVNKRELLNESCNRI
jgi:hypothetical protein